MLTGPFACNSDEDRVIRSLQHCIRCSLLQCCMGWPLCFLRSTGVRRIRRISICGSSIKCAHCRTSLLTDSRLEVARRAHSLASVSEHSSTHVSISDALLARFRTSCWVCFDPKTCATLSHLDLEHTRVPQRHKSSTRFQSVLTELRTSGTLAQN